MSLLQNSSALIGAIAVLSGFSASGQAGVRHLDTFGQYALEREVFEADERAHLAVWPIQDWQVPANDSVQIQETGSISSFRKKSASGNWIWNASPMLDLSAGSSSQAGFIYTAAAGVQTSLSHKNKLSLSAEIFGGSERAPQYINHFVDSLGVLPGLGRNRGTGDALAFVLPSFVVSYKPSQYFQLDAGFGANRFGNGHRSMLLSDVAFNYPYFKITTDVWRFKYVNLFSALTHVGDEPLSRSNFQPKYTASHYLSWAISRRVTFALFETIVWQGRDSLSDRGFDPHYLNPIIFYRPVEFAIGSADNALVGAELSVRLGKKTMVYGQFVLDEFLLVNLRERNGWWANKWSLQLGAKVYDVFGVEGLRAQAEFNVVRPFTYSHGSVKQNYAHFNQSLAHPLGANFYEGLMMLFYEKDDWYAESHTMLATFGRDDSLNFGGDIFRSYVNPAQIFGNTIGQGLRHDVAFQRVTLGRIMDERTGLRLSCYFTYRAERVGERATDSEYFFGLQLSTGLRNRYRDF